MGEYASRTSDGEKVKIGTCGCGKVGVPHPKSYRPDLPLRGLGLGKDKPTVKWTLTAKDKNIARPAKPVYNASKPHPASYGFNLPLRSALTSKRTGYNWETHEIQTVDRYRWPLTAGEKAMLAARPLRYSHTQVNVT